MGNTATDALIREFIEDQERNNKSEDFINGALVGMSFIVEFLQSMKKLEKNKNQYLREEFYVSNQVTD